MKTPKKAFTLVELIVVITILAILGTIAFISLQGYTKNARDSRRVSDVNNIQKSLELFSITSENYPLPDNAQAGSYSGEVVWYQGTLGDSVTTQLSSNLKQKPTDPLFDTEYIYSTTEDQSAYEIAAVYEGSVSSHITQETHAAETGMVKVDGTYNGLFAETDSYIIPIPSLVTAESLPLTLDNTNIKSQVVTGLDNRPANGGSSATTQSLNTALWVYTGSVNRKTSREEKLYIIRFVQNAYTGTTLANVGVYKGLLGTTTNAEISSLANATLLGSTSTEDTFLISEEECSSAGWYWVDGNDDVRIGTIQGIGFCISPRIGDFGDTAGNGMSWNGWGDLSDPSYGGWDPSSIDDTGNDSSGYGQTRKLDTQSGYSCKSIGSASSDYDTTDTLVGRMKWLVTNASSLSELQDVDWISGATPSNGSIPALFLSDCIDGIKDLTTTMIYKHIDDTTKKITYSLYNQDVSSSTNTPGHSNVTYLNRQKYLTAWTQNPGSHIPSAFSYISDGTSGGCESTDCSSLSGIGRGEYQRACEAGDFGDGEDTNNEWINTAAIGSGGGEFWGYRPRIMGKAGCAPQGHSSGTGFRGDSSASRFVIRP